MRKPTHILISLFALMLLSFGVNAQVQSSQSRLNIGKNANPKVTTATPVTGYVSSTKVPNEIKVNKNSAVTEFYRDLLLQKTNKVISPKVTYTATAEKTSDDHLFFDDEISISNIYPNPANEYATLDFRLKSNKTAKVSFINILGGTVGEYNLNSLDRSLRIETRSWDNGIYFYQLVLDGKKVATKKLLVRHN